jgi:hypothetical protein
MAKIEIVPVGDLPAGYQYVTTAGAPVEVVDEIINHDDHHSDHHSDHHHSDHHHHR